MLLLNDPTRGVDVETKREIYLMLRQLRRRGQGRRPAQSDTPELVHLCDRVAVFARGAWSPRSSADELCEEAIVGAAMGARGRRRSGLNP